MGKVIFSVCPHLRGDGEVPRPRSVGGGTPSQVWVGGTLSQVWVGGIPSQVWVGGTLSQVCTGEGGTPEYPWPGLDGGGVPEVPPGQVWMVGEGVPGYPPPPARSGWWGYPRYPLTTRTEWGTPQPIRQSSIASTCYAVDGMSLAFTQEDFLVCVNMFTHGYNGSLTNV